jgi:hypothetical protein
MKRPFFYFNVHGRKNFNLMHEFFIFLSLYLESLIFKSSTLYVLYFSPLSLKEERFTRNKRGEKVFGKPYFSY